MKMKLIVVAFGLSLMANQAIAQKDTVGSEKSVIVKPYQPILQEPLKVNVYPNPETAFVQPPKFFYVPLPKGLDIKPVANSTSAQTLPKKNLELPGGGSIVLGFGNYASPLASFNYGSSIAGNTDYGITGNHFSLNGNDISRKMSQTNAGIYATQHLERVTIGGRLNWEQNTWKYFGATQELIDSLGSKGLGINNTIWRGNSFLRGRYQTKNGGGGQFGIGGQFHYLKNNLGQEEQWFGYKLNGTTAVKNNPLSLVLDMEFSKLTDSASLKRNLIKLEPGYQFGKGALKIYVGFRGMLFKDTSSLINFNGLPQLRLNASLMKNRLQLEAGFKGDVTMLTLDQVRALNPFLGNNLSYNFKIATNVYAYLQGLVMQGFSLKTTGYFNRISNQPLFVLNEPEGRRSYSIIYDDMDWYRFEFEGMYQKGQADIRAGVTYNMYQMDNYAYAFQMPKLEINIHGGYQITNQIQVATDLIVLGKRYSGIWDTHTSSYTATLMKPVTEIHLKGNYQLSKEFSTFLEVNNTLAARYQVWNYYKAAGIQVLVGGRFLF